MRHYYGQTFRTFKKRYYEYKRDLRQHSKSDSTTLSTYVWRIREAGVEPMSESGVGSLDPKKGGPSAFFILFFADFQIVLKPRTAFLKPRCSFRHPYQAIMTIMAKMAVWPFGQLWPF